ncbi:hypothetical protein ACROYT_G016403 [Oculina patagonica]
MTPTFERKLPELTDSPQLNKSFDKLNWFPFLALGVNWPRIFKCSSNSNDDQASKIAKGILDIFHGFDAFKLPPPASDPEVLLNLNNTEVQQAINKSFVRGVQEFKAMLMPKLAPKSSFNDGDYVTGEGNNLK